MATIRFGRRRRRSRAAAAACAIAALCATGAVFATSASAAPPPVWTAPVPTDLSLQHPVTSVTCPLLSLCVGLVSSDVVTSATPAAAAPAWQKAGTLPAPPTSGPATISCPQGGFCVVAATGGEILSATNPSASWTSTTVDSGHTLTSVACPSASLCLATDDHGSVFTSANAGAASPTWSLPNATDGTSALNAISCPTASFCAAADATGGVRVSTNPAGGPWQRTPVAINGNPLTDISCTSSTACVAVDADGNVYATANAATPPVTWSTTQIDPSHVPAGVSCTDSGLCVFVDDGGAAYASDNVTAARPTWTPSTIDGDALTGISCNVAGFCVAVDSIGRALEGSSPLPAPTTGTGSASDQTDATVTATVDPGDAVLTDCHFDYGTSTAYGATVPCATTPVAGGGAQAVSAQIGGLAAGTTYHFRIATATAVGVADGGDGSFVTPPPLKASPSLAGTPAVGSTLTCKPNVATTATEVVTFQWLTDTVPIASANAATYVVQTTDATHHLSCQVTISGDGGSASATSGFDAIPSQSGPKITESVVGTAKDSGAGKVSAPVTCSPQAAGNCSFTLTLTATQTVRHKTKTVTIGSSKATVSIGATRTLSVSLNATGRSLLASRHTLPVKFTVAGTVLGTLKATLQTDKFTFHAAKQKTAPKKHKTATRQKPAPRHATKRAR